MLWSTKVAKIMGMYNPMNQKRFWRLRPPKVIKAIIGIGLLLAFVFLVSSLYALRNQQSTTLSKQDNEIGQSTENSVELLQTSDWNVYEDPVFHYSVMYPPDWSIKSEPNDPFIYFKHPNPRYQQVFIRAFPKSNSVPLARWVEETFTVAVNDTSSHDMELVYTGGISAMRVDGLPRGPMGGLHYFVELNDGVLYVGGGPYYTALNSENLASTNEEEIHRIALTILSTISTE